MNFNSSFNFANTQKPPIFNTQKTNTFFGSANQNQSQSQSSGFSFGSQFNKPPIFSSNQPQQQQQGHGQTQSNNQTQFGFGKTTGTGMNGINGTSSFGGFGGFLQQKQGNNTFGQQKNDLQMPTLTKNNVPNASSNGSVFSHFGLQNANSFSLSKPGLNTNTVSNFPTSFNSMTSKKKFEPVGSKNVKLDHKHLVKCITCSDENNGQCMKQLRAKFYMNGGNQQQNGNLVSMTSSFGFGNLNGGKIGNGGNIGGNGQGGSSGFSFGSNGSNGFSFGGGNLNTGVSIGGGNGFGGSAGGSNTMFGNTFGNGSANTMNPQNQSAFNFGINSTNSHSLPQNNTNFTPNSSFNPQNQFNSQKTVTNTFGNSTGTFFGNNNNGLNTNSFGNGMNSTNGNAFSFGNHSNSNMIPQTSGNMGFGQGNNCNQMNQNMQVPNQSTTTGMFGPAVPQFSPQYTPNTLNVYPNNFTNPSPNIGNLQYQSSLINSFLGSDIFKSMLANYKIEPFEQLTNRITSKQQEQAKEILNDYHLELEQYAKNKFYRPNKSYEHKQKIFGNVEFYKNQFIFTDPNSYEVDWGKFNKFDVKISKPQRSKNQETSILKKTPLNDYQECFDKFQKKTLKEIAVKPESLPVNDSGFILSPSLQKLSEMTSFELSRIPNMKFENQFGRILFKTPINILNKKLSESLNIGQDEFEIMDPSWQNSRCEVLLKNFSRYTELSEGEKNKIERRMKKWADRNKLTILQFDRNTGDITLQFCS